MPKRVASISLGLDGTCLNMMQYAWREAMCGTISFFDNKGERMHTVYTAGSPEYGKEKFLKQLGREVENVIELFPKTPIVGLADGASSNWKFLESYSDVLTLDFWHASEYLARAAKAIFPKKSQNDERKEWLEDSCHKLKHNVGGATRILNELISFKKENKMNSSNKKELQTVITYFTNQRERMAFYKNVEANIPIGFGVTEAACKTIVKNRMCKGAVRWKDSGASVVLTIRSIHMTTFRWDQFWNKYSQYGYLAAGEKVTSKRERTPLAVTTLTLSGRRIPTVENAQVYSNQKIRIQKLIKIQKLLSSTLDDIGLIDDDDIDLNLTERVILHAMGLVEGFNGFFSVGFDLKEVRTATVYVVGKMGNIGGTAIIEAMGKDGKVLGSYLGGFLVAPCQ